MSYNAFHELCIDLERRFPLRQVRLASGVDLDVIVGDDVLNFGSGKFTRADERLCKRFHTFDTDPGMPADYRNFIDIPILTKFDGILAEQVFEHIPKDDLLETMGHIVYIMKPGARIVATIPNVSNWWKYVCDYDHKSPMTCHHLGALFEQAGIEVTDIYRYTKRPEELENLTDVEKAVLSVLRKFFEMDPAHFIAVVGRKR